MTTAQAQPTDKKRAQQWLRSIAGPAKNWIQLTIAVNFVSGICLIVQLYILAHIIYLAYMQGLAPQQMVMAFIVMGALMVTRAFFSWLREIVGFQTAWRVKSQVRMDLLHHINRLGPVASARQSNAALVSSAMDQVEALGDFFTHFLPQITLSALMPMTILIFVFWQNWVCGVILLVCAPLLPIFMIIVGMGAESENQKHFQTLSRMSGRFLDTLQGLSTLKLFNRSQSQGQKLYEASDAYRKTTMRVLRMAFLSSAVLEFFAALSIALVAIYLGLGFINAGTNDSLWWQLHDLTLQGGLFILLLAPEFFLPLRELSTHYHAKAKAIGGAMEIQKILDLPEQTADEQSKHAACPPIETITFDQVSVAYQGQTIPALQDINLTIHQGEKIAIVGASGAGKSTLINALLQFIQPQTGMIQLNRQLSLDQISQQQWLTKISWLGQDPLLLQGTLRDNLLLANPKADADQLEQALQTAHLQSVVNQLPKGLDSFVGEQGQGLSGGQAQRLALARAYLKPCELLLLDEPTASLDTQSEQAIMDGLTQFWFDKTVLMLTHRLNYLYLMDRVIVLDHGRLVEMGTASELLAKADGYLYALYHEQGVVQ